MATYSLKPSLMPLPKTVSMRVEADLELSAPFLRVAAGSQYGAWILLPSHRDARRMTSMIGWKKWM